MKTPLVDQYFQKAKVRIEREKVAVEKAKQQERLRQKRLEKRTQTALNKLGLIARQALRIESDFSQFMLEKIIRDYYNPKKFRITIQVIKPKDIGILNDLDRKPYFLFVKMESDASYPTKLHDFGNISVSCGFETSACGRINLHEEIIPSFQFLELVEAIDCTEAFVEICVQTNLR